jgi:hypothetical protein
VFMVVLWKSGSTYLLLLLLVETFVDFLLSLGLAYELGRAK